MKFRFLMVFSSFFWGVPGREKPDHIIGAVQDGCRNCGTGWASC